MLWLCIHFPYLSLEVHTRGAPAFSDFNDTRTRPLALSQGRLVWRCNESASKAGVRAGMRLADAQALCAALTLRVRDPGVEAAALERLAAWAGQFSSYVSLAPPQALLLEVGASLKLFGDLNKLCAEIQTSLRALGFEAGLAAAPAAAAARLLAECGRERLITESGALAAALAPVPINFLPVSAQILAALHALGLTCLGDCLRLPRAGLIRRFGREFVDYLDRALDRTTAPLQRYAPPAQFESRLAFPEEVAHTEPLLFALSRLVSELTGFLRATDTGIQQLDIDLIAPRLPPQRLRLGLVAPNRDGAHLLALLRERLQRVELQAPVQEIILRAAALIPWQAATGKLFHAAGAPKKDPLALVEQLQARLGTRAVYGITALPEHRPQRAWQGCPPLAARSAGVKIHRPVWLLPQPAPIEPPPAQGMQLTRGPERIEGGWWDGGDIAHDYFIALNRERRRFWVYQERRGQRRWFVQGIFA